MNKERFLKELSNQLKKMPNEDRQEVLTDFEEHFQVGLENGKTEEEISKSLGHPKVIAKELLADFMVAQAETDQSVASITRAIFATISLSFFNIIVLLAPVVLIIGLYVSLGLIAVAFTISPLLLIVGFIFGTTSDFVLELFMSITLCGIGLLLSIATIYVGKFLYKVIIRYVKFNVKVIKGGVQR
ncbi:DUF1700 domain-containing protein [Metabacillus malikii]|uniref:Membrane protein n=1 Tax=Metabacillus malikii TaxID=1504265 RepID=A0ABT9ZGA6_9BACI|nr:DUF1700 domain-containing protein [Metabacillus malikii]MDQ0230827.1 putative membrane protein [Metabacillus malikii]